MNETRDICTIAREITKDWGSKISYSARPYLDAMYDLRLITDKYYLTVA